MRVLDLELGVERLDVVLHPLDQLSLVLADGAPVKTSRFQGVDSFLQSLAPLG